METKTGMVRAARLLSVSAILLIVIVTAGVYISSALVDDTGFKITAFLVVLPFTLILGGVLGLVAVVLSVVVAFKSEQQKKNIVMPLWLGIIAILITPIAGLIWVWAAG